MIKGILYLFSICWLTSFTVSSKACNLKPDSVILTNALKYIETLYLAHTLEFNDEEQLVINKKQVDCTTFVEYVLAESLSQCDTTQKLSETGYLQKIRYRNGVIKGYTSRLHYITEWIIEGQKNNFIIDLTQTYGIDSMYVALSYMSRHPQYYKHLYSSKSNTKAIADTEKKLSGQIIKWIPKDSIPEEGFSWLRNGDVVALTVGIYGLDISHIGIAVYKENKLHLLHASSTKGKVIIEPVPLSLMLKRNKHWTGIRVLRAKLDMSDDLDRRKIDFN
jgi:hypothetical protein